MKLPDQLIEVFKHAEYNLREQLALVNLTLQDTSSKSAWDEFNALNHAHVVNDKTVRGLSNECLAWLDSMDVLYFFLQKVTYVI